MRVLLDQRWVGQRFDRALVEALEQLGHPCTRSALARAFAAGGVTSQGRRIKPGRVVETVTELEIVLPQPEPLRAKPEAIPVTVVYEDPYLLVVDKPAPMVVHAGPGHPRGTLVNAVLHHLQTEAAALPVLPGNDASRPGIVHRLDRDTSGLLVVAKTQQAQTGLAAAFREHDIDRQYLGIVQGHPVWDNKRVETLHGRDPGDRRRFSPGHGTRRAVTNAAVERRLAGGVATVRFELETGRTHQIRMHARHIGHAILADAIYGHKPKAPRVAEQAAALGRHALHARTLGFAHPVNGQTLRFSSPLPEALEAVLAALED